MKNCGAGNRKRNGSYRLLRYLAAAWFLVYETSALATPPRRTWIFEQLSEQPMPTRGSQARHEISLDAVNYETAVSAQASGLLDFREFELYAQASKRWLLQGAPDLDPLGQEYQTLSVEIARFHSLSEKQFGRMGLGYIQFFPDNRHWLKLDIATGVFSNASSPWEFRLNAELYFNLSASEDLKLLTLGTETLYSFAHDQTSNGFQLGGFFRWSYIMIGGTDYSGFRTLSDPNSYVLEHLGFSLGPVAYWNTALGTLRVAVPLRLYVDRDVTLTINNGPGPVRYPNQFLAPELDVRLSIPL